MTRVISDRVSAVITTTEETVQFTAHLRGPPSVRVQRELVTRDAANKVINREPTRPISRVGSAIALQSVTLADGRVVQTRHVLEALEKLFDVWSAEDEANQSTEIS